MTAEKPAVNFTASTSGKYVFTVDFPYTVTNTTPTKAEFSVSHVLADGTAVTDPPIAAAITKVGNKSVLQMKDAQCPLGESIRIEPILYYKAADGTETAVPGTAYEAKPAGIDELVLANLKYEINGYDVDYSLNLKNIRNNMPGQPAGSSLIISKLDFVFLDQLGNPVAPHHTVNLTDAVSGTTYAKSGTLNSLPAQVSDARNAQVTVYASWQVDGKDAVLTQSSPIDGVPMMSAQAEPPIITAASSVGGTSKSNVTISFPYMVQGVTPKQITIEAQDNNGFTDSVTGVPTSDGPDRVTHSMSCVLSPGETMYFDSTLQYDDFGTSKTVPGYPMSVTAANMAPAWGSLYCKYNSDNSMNYEIDVSGIVNEAYGDNSGVTISGITFVFTPTDGGTPVSVQAPHVVETLISGNSNFWKKNYVDLTPVPTGTYNVTAIVSGKWILNGTVVQDVPTKVSVNCLNPVSVSNYTRQVSMPTATNSHGFTITPLAIGSEDAVGNVFYQNGPVHAKPGSTVYLKFAVDAAPGAPCKFGDLLLSSSAVSGFTHAADSPALPKFSAGTGPEHLEYIYSFQMPDQDVTDIAVNDISMRWYVKVAVNPTLLDHSTLGASQKGYYISSPVISPVGAADEVVTSGGEVYVENGKQFNVSATVGIKEEAVAFLNLIDTSVGTGDKSLFSMKVEQYASSDAEGNITDGVQPVSHTFTVVNDGSFQYTALAFSLAAGTS